MENQQQQAAPAAPQTQAPPPQTQAQAPAQPSPVLQEAQQLKEEAAKKQQQDEANKAMWEDYQRLKAEDDARKAAAAEAKRKEAETWLQVQKEAVPAELWSDKYAEQWKQLVTVEASAADSTVRIQRALAEKIQAQNKSLAEQLQELKDAKTKAAELEQLLAKSRAEATVAESHMRDARNSLRSPASLNSGPSSTTVSSPAVPVNASGSGNLLRDIFVPMVSRSEPMTYRLCSDSNNGQEPESFIANSGIPVTASSNPGAPNGVVNVGRLDSHRFLNRVADGPRGVHDAHGNPVGAGWEAFWLNTWSDSTPVGPKYRFIGPNVQESRAFKHGTVVQNGRSEERVMTWP
jgi:hypothetical protein